MLVLAPAVEVLTGGLTLGLKLGLPLLLVLALVLALGLALVLALAVALTAALALVDSISRLAFAAISLASSFKLFFEACSVSLLDSLINQVMAIHSPVAKTSRATKCRLLVATNINTSVISKAIKLPWVAFTSVGVVPGVKIDAHRFDTKSIDYVGV